MSEDMYEVPGSRLRELTAAALRGSEMRQIPHDPDLEDGTPYLLVDDGDGPVGRRMTSSDLLTAVRAGVESGTIKGEKVCVCQNALGESVIHMAGNPMADAADNLQSGAYWVISDGGEDR